MAKEKFTIPWIEGLDATGKEQVYWDEKQPGLGLRVSPKGKVYFHVQYRIKTTGKRPRLALGPYGSITLDEARERARRYVSDGHDGIDRRAVAKAAQNAREQRITFGELADQWMANHIAPKRSSRTYRDYASKLRLYLLPRFSETPVEDISRSAALALHKEMADAPKSANYAVAVAKAAFNFGIRNELLAAGIQNPFSGIELYKLERAERYLSDAELIRLSEALSSLEREGVITPWAAAAIRLLILTGARSDEILQLRWGFIHFDQKVLLLPTSKTGKKSIQLSDAAIAVLKSVPRLAGNPFVIVGLKTGTHLTALRRPWKRLRDRADIENCRIHDLRHSFASFAAADGVPLLMIGKLLGHTSPKTTARYAHLADDALQKSNARIGEKLAGLMGGTDE